MDYLEIFLLTTLYLLAALSFMLSFKIYNFCHIVPPKIDSFEEGVQLIYGLTNRMQVIVLEHEQQINELGAKIKKIEVMYEKEEPVSWKSN